MCCSAGGPPVEQPMTTSSMPSADGSGVGVGAPASGARSGVGAPTPSSATRRRRLSIRSSTTCITLPTRSFWISSSRGETRPPGLAMKSSAPSSSALNTLRSLEREETAITAVGRLCISQRRKANPSITGSSGSRVMTSGRCRMACLIPSSPLTAVATTLMSGCDSSIREMVTRLYAESSMTRARIMDAACYQRFTKLDVGHALHLDSVRGEHPQQRALVRRLRVRLARLDHLALHQIEQALVQQAHALFL